MKNRKFERFRSFRVKYFRMIMLTLIILFFFQFWVWGLQLDIGGIPPLSLSRYRIVYEEGFSQDKQPEEIFWGVLGFGKEEDGPWVGEASRGTYLLSQHQRPAAVKYYYVNLLPGFNENLSSYGVSVDVYVAARGQYSGAGLIYAFDSSQKHYLAFIIGPDNSYYVYKRGREGLKSLTSGSTEVVIPGSFNLLSIIPDEKMIHFYVNGTGLVSLKDESLPKGGVGIIGISTGKFQFDNFILYETKASPKESIQRESAPREPTRDEPTEKEPSQVESTQKSGSVLEFIKAFLAFLKL